MPYAGSRFDVVQPGDGEVTRLPVVLLDDDGAAVTGEAYNAAGMDVEVAKPGGAFAAFPTFATENWHEIGRGVYEVIVRGDDADEKALLDTEGTFLLYVKTTASSANTALHAYKVSPADVARDDQWTDTRAGRIDDIATPAEIEATIAAAHGDGQYDQGGALAVTAVVSRLLEEGDDLAFVRDTTPQTVSFTVTEDGSPKDLSGWDVWLTIKPVDARDDADNTEAVCSIAGTATAGGLIQFTVTADDVADMVVGRAYDYSAEGASGEQYQLFRRGTARMTYNVRRDV